MKRPSLLTFGLAIFVVGATVITRVMVSTNKVGAKTPGQSQQSSIQVKDPTSPTMEFARSLSPEQLFLQCSPAVVTITTADKDGNPIATGTGFIISSDGLLVSNYHVFQNAEIITARLTDGSTQKVTSFLIAHPFRDLIVLKLKDGKYSHLDLADTTPNIGAKVYTIGNPEGLSNTFADGLVSSIRNAGTRYERIQISAPISPGSSGGPALDKLGKVIGVTTSFVSGAQNLNFAISSATVKDLLRNRPDQPQAMECAPFWWTARATARLNHIGNNTDIIKIKENLAIAYARSGDITSALSLLGELTQNAEADFSTQWVRDEIGLSLGEIADPEEALQFLKIPLPIHTTPNLPADFAKKQQEMAAKIAKLHGVNSHVYRMLTESALAHNQLSFAQTICAMIEPGWERDFANDLITARSAIDEGSETVEARIRTLPIKEQSEFWLKVAVVSAHCRRDADAINALSKLQTIAIKESQESKLDSWRICAIWSTACQQSNHREQMAQAWSLLAKALQNRAKMEEETSRPSYANIALQFLNSGDRSTAIELLKAALKVTPLEKYSDLELVNIAILQRKTGDNDGYDRSVSILESRDKKNDFLPMTNVIEAAGAVGDLPRLNKALAAADSLEAKSGRTSMDASALVDATKALLENKNWDELATWISDLDSPAKQALAQATVAAELAQQMNEQ